MTLSGCIAAAVPLMGVVGVGMGAFSGFEMYKSVQLASGGSVEIEFPGKDGKTSPPQPLAPVRRVAVWPGDEGDVAFAQRLQGSGRFATVVAPASVFQILTDVKGSADLKLMTEEEEGKVFDTLCQRSKVELVLASKSLGASTNDNAFSFSRATVTAKADLLAYSCSQRAIVWRDQIILVMKLGGGSTSSSSELNKAGADAWADRIFSAMAAFSPRGA